MSWSFSSRSTKFMYLSSLTHALSSGCVVKRLGSILKRDPAFGYSRINYVGAMVILSNACFWSYRSYIWSILLIEPPILMNRATKSAYNNFEFRKSCMKVEWIFRRTVKKPQTTSKWYHKHKNQSYVVSGLPDEEWKQVWWSDGSSVEHFLQLCQVTVWRTKGKRSNLTIWHLPINERESSMMFWNCFRRISLVLWWIYFSWSNAIRECGFKTLERQLWSPDVPKELHSKSELSLTNRDEVIVAS